MQLFTVLCLNSYCGYFELKLQLQLLCLTQCSIHTFFISRLRLYLLILCWQPLHLLRWHALMISLSKASYLLCASLLFSFALNEKFEPKSLVAIFFFLKWYHELIWNILMKFKHSNSSQAFKLKDSKFGNFICAFFHSHKKQKHPFLVTMVFPRFSG